MKSLQNKCPCCSGKLFNSCCEPFLLGNKLPATAVELMRSRYCAYSFANIDYISHTMRGKATQNFNSDSAKEWAQNAIWCGLTILDPGKQTNNTEKDEVEFAARYIMNNTLFILQERSQFEKIEGKWYYVSGTLTSHPPRLLHPSDPCPCGSRKKFSQCCGKLSRMSK